MTDEQMKKVSNEALLMLNTRLNQIQTKINNIWSSATSDNFQEVYNQAMEEIDKIYGQIDTYNESSLKLEQYNKNKTRIKELQDLIANERAHPSKEVKYTYIDENGKEQTGTKYEVDTDKINGWQTEINSLEADNATLKTEIESLLAKILPTNLQPKNNSDIAHRGYHPGGIWENSRDAFIAAGEKGFWGAEADVLYDSKGNIVVSHGTKDINSKTITIEEYLDVCKEYGMTAIIDLKYDSDRNSEKYKSLGPTVAAIIEEKGMTDSCVIQTNHDNDIPNIRESSKDVRIWLLGYNEVTDTQIKTALDNNVECINFNDRNKTMTEDNIEKITASGIDACVWNVWSEDRKETIIGQGAKYVMSDEALGTTPYQEGDEDFNGIAN